MHTEFDGLVSMSEYIEKIKILKSSGKSPTLEESTEIMQKYISEVRDPYIGIFTDKWFPVHVKKIIKLVNISDDMMLKLIYSNTYTCLAIIWNGLNDYGMDSFVKKYLGSRSVSTVELRELLESLSGDSRAEFIRRLPSYHITKFLAYQSSQDTYIPGIAAYLDPTDHNIWYMLMREDVLFYIRRDIVSILVGLADLDLPVLITYEILYQLSGVCRDATMYDVWQIISKVKHHSWFFSLWPEAGA